MLSDGVLPVKQRRGEHTRDRLFRAGQRTNRETRFQLDVGS